MALKIDIDQDWPYLNSQVFDCDEQYAYSLSTRAGESGKLISYSLPGMDRIVSNYAMPGPLHKIFSTSTEEVYFTSGVSNFYGLYRTNDRLTTAPELVCKLGDSSGTHVAGVYLLQRGLREGLVAGSRVVIFGEYGGILDVKIRLMMFDPAFPVSASNPSVLASWNTIGRQISHIHCVAFDQFTNDWLVGFGDGGGDLPLSASGILRWTPSVGVWEDNKELDYFSSINGFKSISGDASKKTVDILCTENFYHWMSDTASEESATLTGIFRCNKDFSNLTRVNSDNVNYFNHSGWAGCVTQSGGIIFTTAGSTTAIDFQSKIYSSENEGALYDLVGLFGTKGGNNFGLNVSCNSANVFLGTNLGVKNNNDTAVCTVSMGVADEFPTVVHPCYFVGKTNSLDQVLPSPNNFYYYGSIPLYPYANPGFALVSSHIPYGSRVIINEGDYPTPYQTQVQCVGKLGTGMIVVEGAGKKSTTWRTTLANTASYSLLLSEINGGRMLLKDLLLYGEAGKTLANGIVWVGSATNKNTLYIRDAKIGSLLNDTGGPIRKIEKNSVINAERTTWEQANGSQSGGIYAAGGDGEKTKFISLLDTHLGGRDCNSTTNTDVLVSHIHCLHIGQITSGIRYFATCPIVKNSIFIAGAPSCVALRDDGTSVETDAVIDHNCFYGMTNHTVSVSNAGGGHSIIASPGFVSPTDFHLRTDSPLLGTGTKIPGITKDIENNPLFPPYNIGPYGLVAGALGVAQVANDGPPKNNITRLTGESTVINPAGTYILSDTNSWRVVTGWTAGTANDFFDAAGLPIQFTGQQLLDSGIGPRLYLGLKGIGGYTVDQDAPTNAKIIKILKVPTYIDTLYWSDSAEMDWSASNE